MEDEKDKVNEPAFPYKSIRASSFESLEQENRLYSIKLTPIQRLMYLKELNINAFGKKSLLIKKLDKHIYKK